MNTTPFSIFFYHAVIVPINETGVLYESGVITEAKFDFSKSEDYRFLYDNLCEAIVDSYQRSGRNFDPQKHRVVVRSLSRLQ